MMLFGTFQSLDYFDKPITREAIPEGLFKGDISHGIAWCFPITDNFNDSIVNAWMCCPNYGELFVVFESEDYHKVDKVEWYQAIVNSGFTKDFANNQKTNSIKFWDYINDDLEDNHAEFIVPHSIVKQPSCLIFSADIAQDSKNRVGTDPQYPEAFDRVNRRLYPYAQKHFMNTLRKARFFNNNCLTAKEKMIKQMVVQQTLFRAFSLFYLPLIFISFINGRLKNRNKMLPYITDWELYADRFYPQYLNLQLDFAEWTKKSDLSKEGLDFYRQRFLDFFRYNINIIHARLGEVGRNEECPCGSGKKFKACCGKGYV